MSLLTAALQQRTKKGSNEPQKLTENNEYIVEFTAGSPSETAPDDQIEAMPSAQLEHSLNPGLESQDSQSVPADVNEIDGHNVTPEQDTEVTISQNNSSVTSPPVSEVSSNDEASKAKQQESEDASKPVIAKQTLNSEQKENIQLTTKSVFNLPQKAPIKRKQYYWMLILAMSIISIAGWFSYNYYMSLSDLTFNLPSQNGIDPMSSMDNEPFIEPGQTPNKPLLPQNDSQTKTEAAKKIPATSDKIEVTKTKKAEIAQVDKKILTKKSEPLLFEESNLTSGSFSNSTESLNKPIQIKKIPVTRTESQHVAKAYGYLTEGQLDQAFWHYQQVIKRSPKNTYALEGLASIKMSQGLRNEARLLYLKLLKIDPDNIAAKSSLLTLDSQLTPKISETGLQNLLHDKPNHAYLNWSLGNQYAARGAWYKARQPYYNAIKAEPENSDFHFNLAICLDHLQRYEKALKYYTKALSLSINKHIHFDRQQAQERIDRLKEVYP